MALHSLGSGSEAVLIYACLLGAFLTHELDAVKRHEWRVLPLTRHLEDRIGEQVFIWAHVPIVATLLWLGAGPTGSSIRDGLAVFAIVHVGLHIAFLGHHAYEFNNPSSWALILLTGLLGTVYLIIR